MSDNLCEKEMPPVKDLGNGHNMKCHLSETHLQAMEHVISFDTDQQGS